MRRRDGEAVLLSRLAMKNLRKVFSLMYSFSYSSSISFLALRGSVSFILDSSSATLFRSFSSDSVRSKIAILHFSSISSSQYTLMCSPLGGAY
jgi:hypothetical protein